MCYSIRIRILIAFSCEGFKHMTVMMYATQCLDKHMFMGQSMVMHARMHMHSSEVHGAAMQMAKQWNLCRVCFRQPINTFQDAHSTSHNRAACLVATAGIATLWMQFHAYWGGGKGKGEGGQLGKRNGIWKGRRAGWGGEGRLHNVCNLGYVFSQGAFPVRVHHASSAIYLHSTSAPLSNTLQHTHQTECLDILRDTLKHLLSCRHRQTAFVTNVSPRVCVQQHNIKIKWTGI